MKKAAITILSVLISITVIAQDDASGNSDSDVGNIATDRPVQSETPTVVPKGYFQGEEGVYFEEGLDYTCDRRSSTDLLAYNLLIKYGIIKNLELRYTFDYFHYETTDKTFDPEETSSIGGVNAPNVGLKYSFLQETDGWKPNLTLSLHSQFDWYGREEFQPEYANLNFRLTAGKTIVSSWYFVGGLGSTWVDDPESEPDLNYYVAQTGYTFFDKLTVIAELYGVRNYEQDDNRNAFNGALVYLINSNHQVDLSGGMGLADNWYGSYIALGYSMRFNPRK
jgi:hypothetical protein